MVKSCYSCENYKSTDRECKVPYHYPLHGYIYTHVHNACEKYETKEDKNGTLERDQSLANA